MRVPYAYRNRQHTLYQSLRPHCLTTASLSAHVLLHMSEHMPTYMPTHMFIHMHIHMPIHTRPFTCLFTCLYPSSLARCSASCTDLEQSSPTVLRCASHMRTDPHAYALAYTHTHICTHICTLVCTHAHTQTHTHMSVRMPQATCSVSSSRPHCSRTASRRPPAPRPPRPSAFDHFSLFPMHASREAVESPSDTRPMGGPKWTPF